MTEILPIRLFREFEPHRIMIAGPCSAESEEQVLDTARILAQAGIRIFRAGVWKPRTRPGCFEGVGSIGLKWLNLVQQETGLSVATEVANAHHVEEALKAGIDLLWIGARTTVNPFTVQEIADSLSGTDIPVLVKNPINPDVDLWLGAIERLTKAGISQIGAIHRGFSTYGETIYRNTPQWQIPIELHRRMPQIPILCDPSHIGGKRSLVPSLAQQAMDLSADGLFIEVHPHPEKALSDASQQLTPDEFINLCRSLVTHIEPDSRNEDELSEFRCRIDECDKRIMELLEKRMQISREIGEYKQLHNLSVLQSSRYNDIVGDLTERGRQAGISQQCIQGIFETIHTESIRQQIDIAQKGKNSHNL